MKNNSMLHSYRLLLAVIITFSFSFAQAQWAQWGTTIPGANSGDIFGGSVAISDDGSIVAVGIPNDDSNGGNAGAVRVFYVAPDGTTSPMGVKLLGEMPADQFGTAVALSGDGQYLVVGAPFFDESSITDRGKVYVYHYDGTAWTEKVTYLGENSDDRLGSALDISSVFGSGELRVVVAAPYFGGSNEYGKVYIYEYDGTNWSLEHTFQEEVTNGQKFGTAVSITPDGNNVAIGAPYDNYGKVYTFHDNGDTTWSEYSSGSLVGNNNAEQFGYQVKFASDGNRLAVSSPNYSSGKGRVTVFDNNSGWTTLGSTIDGVNNYNMLGKAIGFDDSGNKLVVGIPSDDGAASDAGKIVFYDFDGTNWIENGPAFLGDGSNDQFGLALAMSATGLQVIAGAPYSSEGLVKLYKNTSSQNNICIIADYPFDGDSIDIVGGNNGTIYGGVVWDANRFDETNQSLAFNGSNTFVTIPNGLNNLPEGAVSIWVNIQDTSVYFPVLTKNQGSNQWADIHITNGLVNFTLHDSSIVATHAIGDQSWHHIVGLWHDQVMELYVDGNLEASGSIASGIDNLTGCDLVLGNSDDGNNWADGLMDEFRIYDCPLQANQIQEIYHDRGWNILPFEDECLDFNNNLIPQNWNMTHSDSAFIANGRFLSFYSAIAGSGDAELVRLGQMPANLDSVVIEWDSPVTSAVPMHLTAVGLDIMDTTIFFANSIAPDYDYGLVVLPEQTQGGEPTIAKKDSSLINEGVYRNRLVCTNTSMYFTAWKKVNPNVVPFQIEFNPFDLDSTYSLEKIGKIDFYIGASSSVGYNWMDNACIDLIERDPAEQCLLANYKFNGNVADNSGNGWHLTVENGPISFVENRFGVANKAVYLTDNNQELFTNNPTEPLLGNFTVSTWVKPDVLNGSDTCLIFSNYEENGGELMMLGIFEATGHIFFGHVRSDGITIVDQTNFSIPTEAWSHLVLSRDSLAMQYTLYYNGDSIQSFSYSQQPNVGTGNTAYSFSGSEANFNYKGAIDATRIWKCIISPADVDSIYHIGGWPQVMCNDLTIAVTPTDASCGQNNGEANVSIIGGSGIYNIVWSNGDIGAYADTLEAGMHSVQVTDSIYGCMLNQFFNINNTNAAIVSLDVTNNLCDDGETGAIDASVSGGTTPYVFDWSNGSTYENIDHLSSGSYILSVVDANGCLTTASASVTEPSEITATFDITNSSCGNSDGRIKAHVTGGFSPYTYLWSTSSTIDSIQNVPAGSYTLDVTDANGCQASFTTGFSDSGSPMAMVDSTTSAYCNETGNVYVSVTGGSGSYTYEWSNGQTTEDLIGFAPGDYWLTVSDGSCMTMLNTEIPYKYPQTQDLCVVTVDPVTTTNLVVWEKAQTTGIDHYNIYREGFVADEYDLVGTVPFADMSEFTDPVANPVSRSWKYAITAEDACGNASPLSDAHKTIHLNINLGLGGNINLIWDDYVGFDYTTFYINRHTTAAGWVTIDSLPNYLHSYTDTPTDLYGLWYSVTVASPGQCIPTSLNKATGGPYYQSASNIEDEGAVDTKV